MADITFTENISIEQFLGMKTGYVWDFSNQTFQDFVGQVTGLDIFSAKYEYASNSKANRLRAFIKIESNYTISVLLKALCDLWLHKVNIGNIGYQTDENLYKECLKIAERLGQNNVVEHIDSLQPHSGDKDFKLLAKSIRESIEKNEPEVALDRLHTFTVKYVRELCTKHEVVFEKSESLNSIFGKYVKNLTDKSLIESVMSEKILKYSINIIEAFNDIRNNKSLAHDNKILNYAESILIFNNIANSIKFIEGIEASIPTPENTRQQDWEDLPF